METRETMIEKAKTLMAAPSCCAELKAAAQAWIDSIGTDGEKAAAKHFIDELSADILPVDAVLAFMKSDAATAKFGAELAAKFTAHMTELKASGASYCDCPACTAGLDILAHKEAIL